MFAENPHLVKTYDDMVDIRTVLFVFLLKSEVAIASCKLHPSEGRGGLVVRSRPRGRRVAGPKPDSTEDPPCMGPVARQIIRSGQTSSRWCGWLVWRGGCQLRHRPRHLTAVQNYEVRP
ncbi:hypothetical protein AVEN_37800-1 [Araneus ventricosus]|uniref:Uncharacterized protein n=1 Tax=Araneus ventricosus TaxID=182803 RepID=A0A4Y2G3D3_ARAVE|nr:hypothetical protein AVEN_37800-1 [Araneus ventricosus]